MPDVVIYIHALTNSETKLKLLSTMINCHQIVQLIPRACIQFHQCSSILYEASYMYHCRTKMVYRPGGDYLDNYPGALSSGQITATGLAIGYP